MGEKGKKSICIFGANSMLKQVQQLENELDNALSVQDIEAVHLIRVASRRLRSSFEYFKDCLPAKKAKSWQDEIRQITHALGKARDLDIQIEFLNQQLDGSLDSTFKPGYQRLLLRLKQRRVKAQKKVSKTLIKLQDEKVLIKMWGQLEKLITGSENIYLYTPSLYQKAFTAIDDKLGAFLEYEHFIQSPDNVEKLHAMRIAGKNLRYTLEIFAPVYGQSLIPTINAMKDIQNQLGAIHDDDVWISWLPKFIAQEKGRIDDYFGNTAPLQQLLPGFHFLIENRQKSRDELYQAFLDKWETLGNENAWQSLREIIKAPINVESALEHISTEAETCDTVDEHTAELEQELTHETTAKTTNISESASGADIQPLES